MTERERRGSEDADGGVWCGMHNWCCCIRGDTFIPTHFFSSLSDLRSCMHCCQLAALGVVVAVAAGGGASWPGCFCGGAGTRAAAGGRCACCCCWCCSCTCGAAEEGDAAVPLPGLRRNPGFIFSWWVVGALRVSPARACCECGLCVCGKVQEGERFVICVGQRLSAHISTAHKTVTPAKPQKLI